MVASLDYVQQFQHDLDVVRAACNTLVDPNHNQALLEVAGYAAARDSLIAEARLTLNDMDRHRQFDCTKAYPWWLYRTGSLTGTYIRRVLTAATRVSTEPQFAELLARMQAGDKS